MQSGIHIGSKLEEITVIHGKYKFTMDSTVSDSALNSVKYIYSDLNDIQRSFIRLGFHLYEFYNCEYYRNFGYLDIYEFASVNLGMDKSAVSRCINVFKEFSKRGDHSSFMDNAGSRTMYIDDRYKDFSYSQLCEMLSLSDEERRKITSDMTIKDIREFKRNKKEANKNISKIVAMSQPTENYSKITKLHGVALKNYVANVNCLNSIVLKLFYADGAPVPGLNDVYCELIFDDSSKGFPEFYIRLRKKSGNLQSPLQ
ncbi:MAG: hypothetical protein J6J11_00230 [Treponema sp.]|nr:hypothetical protein [Clostridia bacterium]MBP3606738.1 hypothetical protein [Treponema sp.]